MSEASELLEQAKALYLQCTGDYRVAALEVGRLLHRFVLSYLAQGSGLTREQRMKDGITRSNAIMKASQELSIFRGQVLFYIKRSAAIDLLGMDLEVAKLGLGVLGCFSVFVEREYFQANSQRKRHDGYKADVLKGSQWKVKEMFKDSARALFVRAVKERWGQKQAREECNKLFSSYESPQRRDCSFRKKPTQDRSASPRRLPVIPQRRDKEIEAEERKGDIDHFAKVAGPGELATKCMELVEQSPESREVAQLLLARLQVFLARKPRASMVS